MQSAAAFQGLVGIIEETLSKARAKKLKKLDCDVISDVMNTSLINFDVVKQYLALVISLLTCDLSPLPSCPASNPVRHYKRVRWLKSS